MESRSYCISFFPDAYPRVIIALGSSNAHVARVCVSKPDDGRYKGGYPALFHSLREEKRESEIRSLLIPIYSQDAGTQRGDWPR